MASPLIGITTKRENLDPSKITLLENYTKSILRAGGTPVLLPVGIHPDQAEVLALRLDGLLLSGGGDIDPAIYHGRAHPNVNSVDPDRDTLELALVAAARKHNIPLLGICRGMQLINVAFGGSLYTHLPDHFPDGAIQHSNTAFTKIAHPVNIQIGTRLASILRQPLLQVNSLHHQGLKRLGSGLTATALATDDLVEGVETNNGHYLMGVQWHPEALHEDPAAQDIFSSFIEAAAKNQHGTSRR